MPRKLTFLILPLLLLSHCTQEKSDIRVVCESISSGSYKIKWETFPPMDGTVKIYESFVPDSFNLSVPIAEVNISEGFKDVLIVRPSQRSYFNLVFNKKRSVITAERIIPMQGLYNLRDLGGYNNMDGKQIHWGKMYRSSSLAYATLRDTRALKNMGIRTVVDLRTDRERYENPSRYSAPNIINLSLRGNPDNNFFDRILSGETRVSEAKESSERLFLYLLENNSDYFIKMFDILFDTENYPVLFFCNMGGNRSAVVSSLILAALDIDMDQIISDYMLTNEQVDYNSFLPLENIFMQNQDIQETFTAHLRAHRTTFTYAFDIIIKEYGSLDNYFAKELNLTPEKRKKLKEILLY